MKSTTIALNLLIATIGLLGAESPFSGTVRFVHSDDPQRKIHGADIIKGHHSLSVATFIPTDLSGTPVFGQLPGLNQRDDSQFKDIRKTSNENLSKGHSYVVRLKNGHKFPVIIPKFALNQAAALRYAKRIGIAVGQLPQHMGLKIPKIELTRGKGAWSARSASPQGIRGSIGRMKESIDEGWFEEALMHEMAHITLDHLKNHPRWLAAQRADEEFISSYAKRYPSREDIASTYNAWFVLRYRSARVPGNVVSKIAKTIPNRLEFFDSLNLDMSNVQSDNTLISVGDEILPSLRSVNKFVYSVRNYPTIEVWRFGNNAPRTAFTVGGKNDTMDRSFENGFHLWSDKHGLLWSDQFRFPHVRKGDEWISLSKLR